MANKTTKFAVGDKVDWDRRRKSRWSSWIGNGKIVSVIKSINGDITLIDIEYRNEKNNLTVQDKYVNIFWLRKA